MIRLTAKESQPRLLGWNTQSQQRARSEERRERERERESISILKHALALSPSAAKVEANENRRFDHVARMECTSCFSSSPAAGGWSLVQKTAWEDDIWDVSDCHCGSSVASSPCSFHRLRRTAVPHCVCRDVKDANQSINPSILNLHTWIYSYIYIVYSYLCSYDIFIMDVRTHLFIFTTAGPLCCIIFLALTNHSLSVFSAILLHRLV